jgi:hypothetical protein
MLQLTDAERIAGALAARFPAGAIGIYRLPCEIRP